MKKIIILIFLNLFIPHQLIAEDFINFSEGDIFESEIDLGKTSSGVEGFKIPLPKGKFKYILKSKLQEIETAFLFTQVEKDQLNWWIEGTVMEDTGGYLDEDTCKKKRWFHYHSQTYKKNEFDLGYFCNKIHHYAMFRKSEFVVPDDGPLVDLVIKHKEYLLSQNFDRPEVMLLSVFSYVDYEKKRELKLYYFVNPESFGVPKQEFKKNLKLGKKWSKSNFNKKKLSKNPQHKKFIEEFKEISDDLLKRFNQLNNVNKDIAIN